MTEAEARELADEINRYARGWTAYAEKRSGKFNNSDEWWVQAHHVTMRSRVGPSNPFPTLPITSREDWDTARDKWK